MKYCTKCGAQLEDSVRFCSVCGAQSNNTSAGDSDQNTSQGGSEQNTSQSTSQGGPQQGAYGQGYSAPNANYSNPSQGASWQNASWQNTSQNTSQGGPQQGAYGQGYYTPPHVDYSNPAADASANKVYGILAYINLLVLVSIFAAPKESRYSKYHANQGLVLLIASMGAEIALAIVGGILGAVFMASLMIRLALLFSAIFGIAMSAVGICTLVLMIIGIINAANGECKPLPIIGKYTILK